jgi:hypothetical protein
MDIKKDRKKKSYIKETPFFRALPSRQKLVYAAYFGNPYMRQCEYEGYIQNNYGIKVGLTTVKNFFKAFKSDVTVEIEGKEEGEVEVVVAQRLALEADVQGGGFVSPENYKMIIDTMLQTATTLGADSVSAGKFLHDNYFNSFRPKEERENDGRELTIHTIPVDVKPTKDNVLDFLSNMGKEEKEELLAALKGGDDAAV